MKSWINRVLAALVLVQTLACANGGNCRQQAEAEVKAREASGKPALANPAGPSPDMKASATASLPELSAATDHVKVFKYDGSLQCGKGKALSPEQMKSELGALKIYSIANKMDHLMHMQLCGSSTGRANVYEIDRRDLGEATKAGFKQWLWE